MPRQISGTFSKPFPAQLTAFRLRLGNLVPTSRWDDLQKSQHDRGFMVAGATKADLLEDLGKAVDRAISEGRGFDAFKAEFREIVKRRGWHGWTGEGTEAGENWRMRTIYRTNMRTSYMAGRHAQLVEGNYKYWVYRHSGAAHPRLDHLSWDGIALSPDHAFWSTHYPPNGWGCGCIVRGANSDRRVKKVGGDLGKELPAGWNAADPKTGAPKGIGKLWDYAPGASTSQLVNALRTKLDELPDKLSVNTLQSWFDEGVFENWFGKPSGMWPVAKLGPEVAEKIGAKQRLAMLTSEFAQKVARDFPDTTPTDFARIQAVIDGATKYRVGATGRVTFVKSFDDTPGQFWVVDGSMQDGEMLVLAIRKITEQAARRDPAVARLLT